MAWVAIPGNPTWEYENTATDNGAVAGIRTYTKPAGGTEEYYVQCRLATDPTNHPDVVHRGEISKTYYDGQV